MHLDLLGDLETDFCLTGEPLADLADPDRDLGRQRCQKKIQHISLNINKSLFNKYFI